MQSLCIMHEESFFECAFTQHLIIDCMLDAAPCLVGDIEVRHGDTHEDDCSEW